MNQKPARRKKFEHAPPANWRLRLGRCNHRRRALYAVDRPAIDFAAKAANVRLASIVLKTRISASIAIQKAAGAPDESSATRGVAERPALPRVALVCLSSRRKSERLTFSGQGQESHDRKFS
jgi:hypothetical protein